MAARKRKHATDVQIIKTPGGEELVVIPREKYEELLARSASASSNQATYRAGFSETTRMFEDIDFEAREAREHAEAVAAVRAGKLETGTVDEMRALLAAPTPLAFWRKKRGLTQQALAEQVGVSQGFIADIESGKKLGDVRLYKRLSQALDVEMKGLVRD
jgi:DNA-binding XRE family transcriptional regulator